MSNFGLGRGLDALIPRKNSTTNFSPIAIEDGSDLAEKVWQLPVDELEAGHYQPRQTFNEDYLQELAESIKEYGIIQPLVATKEDGKHRLIAGERRLRAAKMAGLKVVPVVMRDTQNHERLALALIENIQRVNLNPIEEAHSYKRLMDEFNLTQDQIAKKVGKSRPKIANMLRLLSVHPEVQEALRNEKINEGHGKILAGIDDHEQQLKFLEEILNKKLSVSQVSQQLRPVTVKQHIRRTHFDPNLAAKEELLREKLGTKVVIEKNNEIGKIVLHFYSEEELNSIINKIVQN